MKTNNLIVLILSIFILVLSCKSTEEVEYPETNLCDLTQFDYTHQKGCDGKEYPNPISSKYILPFPPGYSFKTGLTNCSSSYHGAEYPDRYAFDFDMPVGTKFYATRGGIVSLVIDDQPSNGGGDKYGNWVIIDHQDNTYGIYLHSPKNGIYVEKGDEVKQGDLLGITGKSGLAGYPHLHFIVVQNGYAWPYDPIPVSFKNAVPADVILKSYTQYTACKN